MTKQDLLNDMDIAIKEGSQWFYVVVATRGNDGYEVIVNPKENFIDKRDYYNMAYDDNLSLRTYSGISIIDWGYGQMDVIDNRLRNLKPRI